MKNKGCQHNAKKSCNTCNSRRHRYNNPMRYAYDNLKHNCYRRKGRHFFELTFEEFKQYAIETKYLLYKGITKKSYHIDRRDPTMGYFIGNIRPLPNDINSSKPHTKQLVYEWNDEEGRMVAHVVNNSIPVHNIEDKDLPFPLNKK